MSGRVTIELTVEMDLSAEECFPDGIPDTWDAGTVLAAIQKDGVDAWNLLGYGLDARVIASHPNPHFGQSEALLPDLAPEQATTTTARGTVR